MRDSASPHQALLRHQSLELLPMPSNLTKLSRSLHFLSPCLLLVAALAQQPAVRAVESAQWQEAVAAAIAKQQQAEGIPGLSVAVGFGGEVRYAAGFGTADLENAVPATADTVYRLASISKPVTAVLAMQLVEQGKLDLDRDVAELLPEWRGKSHPVTVRQLLSHTGGVRHYKPGEPEGTERWATQRAALGRFAADPLLHEPGTAYLYSTYGYNLVAAVVEVLTEQPFAAVVQQRIAGPAAAPSLQDDDLRRLIRHRAQGYIRHNGELQNSKLMDGSYKLGGGGLCANAPDLARFGLALLAGELLQPATLQQMWQQPRLRDGKLSAYGLGFRIGRLDGRPAVSHSGAQARVSTMLYCLPDDGIVVVILCNLEKLQLQALAQQVARLVLAR